MREAAGRWTSLRGWPLVQQYVSTICGLRLLRGGSGVLWWIVRVLGPPSPSPTASLIVSVTAMAVGVQCACIEANGRDVVGGVARSPSSTPTNAERFTRQEQPSPSVYDIELDTIESLDTKYLAKLREGPANLVNAVRIPPAKANRSRRQTIEMARGQPRARESAAVRGRRDNVARLSPASHGAAPTDMLSNLPAEFIESIAGFLHYKDVLAYRLTCRATHACSARDFERLYIKDQPFILYNPASMQRLAEFVEDPDKRQYLRCVPLSMAHMCRSDQEYEQRQIRATDFRKQNERSHRALMRVQRLR